MSQAETNDDVRFLQPNRHTALIALGSNLPCNDLGSLQVVRAAAKLLTEDNTLHGAVSRFYATPCFPAGAGPDYVNAALRLETVLEPAEMLAHLHRIETMFGRTRAQRWGMRTLDLDLLAYGAQVLPDRATYLGWRDLSAAEQRLRPPDEMILPHPRLHERAFVLVPLNDIAPGWRHPVLGQTVAAMLAGLSTTDRDAIAPLPDDRTEETLLVKPGRSL